MPPTFGARPRRPELRKQELLKDGEPRHLPVQATAALPLLLGVLTGCAFLAREATIVYLSANALVSAKGIKIEINRSFIENYKNRVTIQATFTVDKAMQNPVAKMFDGDLHL